jgi:hypothetical protein
MPKSKLSNMKVRRWIARNHDDLYHVAVPLALSMIIAAGSPSGSTAFLLVWGMFRELTRVARHV